MTSPVSSVGNATQTTTTMLVDETAPRKKSSFFKRFSFSRLSFSSQSTLTSLKKEESNVDKKEKTDEQKTTHKSLPPTFQEVASQGFYKQFPDIYLTGTPVHEFQQAKEGYVSAVEIADSVALFGKSDNTLFVYHVGIANTAEIVTYLKGSLGKTSNEKFQLYALGGDGSEGSIEIFLAIHAAIKTYFKNNAEVQDLMHVNQSQKTKMVTAALDRKAGLFFYRH